MDVNQETLVSVMRIRDPHGVLSVYVDADPSERTREKPAWEVVIKNELEALRERVKSEEPHETWRALFARLEALAPNLERLLDPKESGRGRALYAAVSNGSVERLAVQLPLPNRVVFERTAYVRPLLAVLDEARPAGSGAGNPNMASAPRFQRRMRPSRSAKMMASRLSATRRRQSQS